MALRSDVPIVLLVDTDGSAIVENAQILRDAGYDVIEVSSFEQARTLLSSLGPDLLITTIQLDAYNGLHLVWRQRMTHPDRPAIVTSTYPDVVLESETQRLGCPFLIEPIEREPLLAAVHALLGPDGDKREWPRTKRAKDLTFVMTQGPARVVDVSYGGCRLRFRPGADVPLEHPLDLPMPADAPIKGTAVWKAPTLDGDDYGFEIGGALTTEDAWRAFVDDLRRRA